MTTATIALIEPYADLRELLQVALEDEGYRVVARASATAAELKALRPDAIVLAAPPRRAAATRALVMALRAGRGRCGGPDPVPIVITSTYHGDVDADLMRAPRVALLLKPFPMPLLAATLTLLGVAPVEARAGSTPRGRQRVVTSTRRVAAYTAVEGLGRTPRAARR